ncbi:MAG: CHAT domain-containing protein, partial [Synechococcaceae cyanobacterium RL_1_2]|nr:CHAT domain-containing protein [Synechococcaceae cyanobacterium RL_1_2]
MMVLLDRGAITEARAVLSSVSPKDLNQSEVSFVRGRLAWEAIQMENENYALDDVRRFWQAAVRENPDNPAYLHALGWAYYGEGNYDNAVNNWYQAIALIKEKSGHDDDIFHVYAGLALAFKEIAREEK